MPLDPAAKQVIDMLEELMPRVEHYESADDVRAYMLANRRELPEPDAVARVEHHVAPGAEGAGVVVRVYWPSDDEGEAYGAQLDAAGVDVVVHRAPGVFHGFFNMDAVLDGAKVAQQVAFDAMRPVLHGDG